MKKSLIWISSFLILSTLGARAPRAQETNTPDGILADTETMEKVAHDVDGEPATVLEYTTEDSATGETKDTGTVEVYEHEGDPRQATQTSSSAQAAGPQESPKDGKDTGYVTIVTTGADGKVKSVQRKKKTYVPSAFGEGYSWWDIGAGFWAGSFGPKWISQPNAPGRQQYNYAGGSSPMDMSFTVRPRILQQRLSFSADMLVNGCNGTLNNYESQSYWHQFDAGQNDTQIMNGINCHVGKSVSGDLAVLRTGRGDGHHHEIALGAELFSIDVDHVDPANTPLDANGNITGLIKPTTTKDQIIMPTVTYRFWSGRPVVPEAKVAVGNNAVVGSFTIHFTLKKTARAIGDRQYDMDRR